MTDHSQSGQTAWAWKALGEPRNGFFLDIGSGHPVEKNNSYGLEQIGWLGLLVDGDTHCGELARRLRKSSFLQADATKINWTQTLRDFLLPTHFHYLSLDVDNATADALANLLQHGVSWTCATIEHDLYRIGPEPRERIRRMMKNAGYTIDKADVSDQGCVYEDFWLRA